MPEAEGERDAAGAEVGGGEVSGGGCRRRVEGGGMGFGN